MVNWKTIKSLACLSASSVLDERPECSNHSQLEAHFEWVIWTGIPESSNHQNHLEAGETVGASSSEPFSEAFSETFLKKSTVLI